MEKKAPVYLVLSWVGLLLTSGATAQEVKPVPEPAELPYVAVDSLPNEATQDPEGQVLTEDWVNAEIKEGGASLYEKPSLESKKLGDYPEKARVHVLYPSYKNFYLIVFSKEWNGVQRAWIPASSLEVVDVSPRSREAIQFRSDFIISEDMEVILMDGEIEKKKNGPKLNFFSVRLGTSSFYYQQTQIAGYREFSPWLKLSAKRKINSQFYVEGDVSGSYFPLLATRRDVKVSFLGGHLLARWTPLRLPRVEASLLGGLGVSSVAVSERKFGYGVYLYPQIFPEVKVNLSPLFSLRSFVRYTYLGAIGNPTQREIAWGTMLLYHFAKEKAASLSVDYSSFRFMAPRSIQIESQSWALSLGFEF